MILITLKILTSRHVTSLIHGISWVPLFVDYWINSSIISWPRGLSKIFSKSTCLGSCSHREGCR